MSNVNVFENVRAAVYDRIETYRAATRPTVAAQYQNRKPIDLDTQVDPWIGVEIVWNDGDVAAMGEEPLVRYRGAIWVSIYVKKNTGTKLAGQIMGELASLLKAVRDPAYYTGAPTPVPAREYKGWELQTLRVPFWTDDR